jgi:hypothetical protein
MAKFDLAALRNHKPKNTIIVERVNEPNIDLMAQAFNKLLRQ